MKCEERRIKYEGDSGRTWRTKGGKIG
jgi:hypothetical protein